MEKIIILNNIINNNNHNKQTNNKMEHPNPIEILSQRQPVEIIVQRAPVETEPIPVVSPKQEKEEKVKKEKKEKEEKVKKEKKEKEEKIKKEKKEKVKKEKKDKIYTNDDSCINMPFYESTIEQDSNLLWLKIENVVLGESSQFSYKSVPCTKIWELLNTVIDDLTVTVINFNEEKGIAFFKSGFDVNVEGDVLINEKYTSFVLKSKLVGNPFVKN